MSPPPVGTGALRCVLREYTAKLIDVDEDSFDGDALVRRCSNSMRKLVGSLARLDGRAVATNKDLKRAAEILTPNRGCMVMFMDYLLEPIEFIQLAKRVFAIMSIAGDRRASRDVMFVAPRMETWSDELKAAHQALQNRFDISEAAWNAFFKEKEKRERRVTAPPVASAPLY